MTPCYSLPIHNSLAVPTLYLLCYWDGEERVWCISNRQLVSAQSAKSSLAEVGDNQNARDNASDVSINQLIKCAQLFNS